MNQNVQPSDFTYTKTIERIQIDTQNLVLGESAEFRVTSYTASGEYVKIDFVRIEGQEYQDWGSSDNYIVDLICTKLGLNKA